MVGIVATCASGPQRSAIVTVSVRKDNSDPTTSSRYQVRTMVSEESETATRRGIVAVCGAIAN